MIHHETRSDRLEAAMHYVLWPGDRFCDWLEVCDPDSRMLLRMFINLTIYGKVALSLVVMTFTLT